METEITISWTSVFVVIFGIFVSLLSFLAHRTVKGYDDQIKELFCRTKDLPAIRKSIEWLERDRNKG